MTPDDVRMTARLVVDKRVHCVSDEAVMALAKRVLELESAGIRVSDAALDVARGAQPVLSSSLASVRAVGVTVEPREGGTGWAVTNTRALEAESNKEEHAENVRATEREACADIVYCWMGGSDAGNGALVQIRARGAKP